MKTQDSQEYENSSKGLPSSKGGGRFRFPFRKTGSIPMTSPTSSGSSSAYNIFNFRKIGTPKPGPTSNQPRKSVSFSGMDWKKKISTDHTDVAYREAVSRLRSILSPRPHNLLDSSSIKGSLGDVSGVGNKSFDSGDSPPTRRDRFNFRSLFSSRESPTKPLNNQLYSYQPPQSGCEDDLFDFIEKQGQYITQLEKETKYCREDLSSMLDKVRDVISENEALHERQKRELLNNMIEQLDEKTDGFDVGEKYVKKSSQLTKKNPSSVILESKIAELEAQLNQSRRSLSLAQEEILEMRKNKISSGGRDSSSSMIPLNVNPYAHCDLHRAEIENLNREKQDLLETLSKFKLMMSELRDRESDAAKKVKNSLEIVETMQHEKSQSDMETRRLKEELARHQQRLKDLVAESYKKIHEEKMQMEMKYRQEIEMLNSNINVEMDSLTRARLELERMKRIELELKRELQVKTQTMEDLRQENLIRMGHMQSELSQALLMKSQAEQDLINSRLLIEKVERDGKQEIGKLQAEITGLRQRMEASDNDLLEAQEVIVKLNENVAHLQRENVVLKNRGEGVGEDQDVVHIIQNMEEKHSKDMTDLEQLIQAQNTLLDKLRGECKMLTDKLDDTSKQYRKERTLHEKEKEKLLNATKLNNDKKGELEKKLSFYSSSHEQITQRLRSMEDQDQARSEREEDEEDEDDDEEEESEEEDDDDGGEGKDENEEKSDDKPETSEKNGEGGANEEEEEEDENPEDSGDKVNGKEKNVDENDREEEGDDDVGN